MADLAACRSRPGTLVIGATAGATLGVVWYVAGPLGFGGAVATNPWLPGADAKPFIVLAVISFFAAPVAAAIVADRRFTGAAAHCCRARLGSARSPPPPCSPA